MLVFRPITRTPNIFVIKKSNTDEDAPIASFPMRLLGAIGALFEVLFYFMLVQVTRPGGKLILRVVIGIVAGALGIYLLLTTIPNSPKCFQLGSMTLGGECRR